MQADIVNVGLGFLEGFALIISPCILPILPIILAGSLTGSKKRPIGIIVGFVIIFSLFTLFSRKLVQLSGIDSNVIRHFAYALLFLFGIMMLSTYLTEKFGQLTQRLANTGSTFNAANNPRGGFISGILFGGSVAIIWTPCAGPILAAVIVQIAIQQTNFMSFLTLLAFGVGAGLPMLMIVFFGRELLAKFGCIRSHAALFRKLLGVIIILSVGYMIYVEGSIRTAYASENNNTSLTLQKGLWVPYKAPSISGIDAWINSEPLQLDNLKGKVILVDFWTYSCINCKRTLPYLNDWYDKYHDKGLVIIGVHTPEFDFEKNLDNVKNAVKVDNIKYPVALDNKFVTWRNFNNEYWPAHYLIDKTGNVVYTHLGEGDYDVAENNIRYLLGINSSALDKVSVQDQVSQLETPETYLGYARARNFSSPEKLLKDQTEQYSFPGNLNKDDWALQGKWKIMSDRIISEDTNSAIKINFNARKVYIVMGSTNNSIVNVSILLNGKRVEGDRGKDVTNSSIKVDKHSIYHAIELSKSGNNILEIIATSPGLEVYTITFGE